MEHPVDVLCRVEQQVSELRELVEGMLDAVKNPRCGSVGEHLRILWTLADDVVGKAEDVFEIIDENIPEA